MDLLDTTHLNVFESYDLSSLIRQSLNTLSKSLKDENTHVREK